MPTALPGIARRIMLASLLIAGLVLAAHPGASHAQALVALSATATMKPMPQFVITQQGGRTPPMVVTIDDSGAITVVSGKRARSWRPRGRLSQDVRDGLLKLAQAEGFFALPPTITAPGPANSTSRSISIRVGTHVTRVTVRLARNRAFDQLYAVLLATADVVGEAPPGPLESD